MGPVRASSHRLSDVLACLGNTLPTAAASVGSGGSRGGEGSSVKLLSSRVVLVVSAGKGAGMAGDDAWGTGPKAAKESVSGDNV
jgi:hypothetical protein